MTLKTEVKNIGIFALLLTGMIYVGKKLDKGSHPQIRDLALKLLELMRWAGLDILFQDLIDEHLLVPKP